MGQLFESLVDYLTEDDWKFSVVKEETAVTLNFRGEAGSWQCFANVDEERQWFTFYSILPSNIVEEKRDDVAEFITRANYGLVIGNFEMDYDDGEVRYKTSVDIEGGELTPKMIENLMRANLMTMDRYFPGIMSVVYGDCDPAEAVADIEGDMGDADLEESLEEGLEDISFEDDGEDGEDEPDEFPPSSSEDRG
jgi:hypothetical protein